MVQKNSKHSKLIDTLEKRVLKKHPNADSFKNVEYSASEIDLFCIFDREIDDQKEKIVYFFEMKSTNSQNSRKKAYKQLEKHKLKYLKKNVYDKTYFFYVYGLGKGYKIKRMLY